MELLMTAASTVGGQVTYVGDVQYAGGVQLHVFEA